MNHILPFIAAHWMLVTLFVLLLLSLIAVESRGKVGGVAQISPQQAVGEINHGNAVIIDTRDANAFKDGHIAGAVNMRSDELTADNKKLNRFNNKTLVICCAQGVSANKVAASLAKAGKPAKTLAGGIQGWRQAELPLVKK